MKVMADVRPEITIDGISRLLGYGRPRDLSRRMLRAIERSLEKSQHLIRPRVLYTEKKIRSVGNGALVLEKNVVIRSRKLSRVCGKCDRAAIFVATIGKGIDSLIRKLTEQKRVAEAYIVDAIGSTAAERTVDAFQRKYNAVKTERGERTTLRFSPGYCDWRVEEQKKLFNVVDNSLIGVELSESYLMTPRKSVSGIFGIGRPEEIGHVPTNPCVMCSMRNCIARRSA
ncbi:MAG: vitamin B12 dependent-methionine synthase activation domain-containing protein [Candidatus Sulfobium sp.]|jgi:Vitamin B12 dependent methionine synthase, activation domain